jgi:hypothetical protein
MLLVRDLRICRGGFGMKLPPGGLRSSHQLLELPCQQVLKSGFSFFNPCDFFSNHHGISDHDIFAQLVYEPSVASGALVSDHPHEGVLT